MPHPISKLALTSHQAFLDLDKSTSSFEEQLVEATRLLGLDGESEEASSSVDHNTLALQFTGKVDYVLRWILRKLQAQDHGGQLARAHPKSWNLVSQLVRRTTLANAAQILIAGKFLHLLDRTLEEISGAELACESEDDYQKEKDEPLEPRAGADTENMNGSVSSATINGSTLSSPIRSSRKRHHDGTLVDVPEVTGRMEGTFVHLTELLKFLTAAVSSIVTRAKTSEHSDEVTLYSQEYMKSVLRSDPATAARLLGRYFDCLWPTLAAYDLNACSWDLEPFLEIWNSRSQPSDDVGGQLSNSLFAQNCLVPALNLLGIRKRQQQQKHDAVARHKVGADDEAAMVNPTRKALERLLVVHILTPSRGSFISLHETGGSADLEMMIRERLKDLKAFLQPLHSAFRDYIALTVHMSNSRELRVAESAEVLLELILRCVSTNRRADRIIERSWSEAVLVLLAETVGISINRQVETAHRASIDQLHRLLQIAIEKHLTVSAGTLGVLASSSSGLLFKKDAELQIGLCGVIFRLNPDAFLVLTQDQNLQRKHGNVENVLLNRLMDRILTVACSYEEAAGADAHRLQTEILLPLIDGFSNARNLLGFLHRWHALLTSLETERIARRESNVDGLLSSISLLEHSSTIKRVQALLEKSLSPSQLERFIRTLILAHFPSEPSSDSCPTSGASACIIIFDTFFGVLKDAQAAESMVQIVQEMRHLLSVSLQCGKWQDRQRWRIRRILANLDDHWPSLERAHERKDVPSSAAALNTSSQQRLIEEALVAFKSVTCNVAMCTAVDARLPERTAARMILREDLADSFREAYEALHFLLSSSSKNSPSDHSQAEMEETYQVILKNLASYESSKQQLEIGMRKGFPKVYDIVLQESKQWMGSTEDVRSAPTFLIASLCLVLFRYPHSLEYLSTNIIRSLWSTLYKLRSEAGIPPHSATGGITLEEVWKGVTESDRVLNHAPAKDALIETNLIALNVIPKVMPESDHQVEIDDGRIASETMRLFPVDVLRKRQRQCALDKLVEDEDSPYLPILISAAVRMMHSSNASCMLTTNPRALWDLARKINRMSEIRTHEQFRELVRLTLQHVQENINQEHSSTFMTEFYEILKKTISSADTYAESLISIDIVEMGLQHDIRVAQRARDSSQVKSRIGTVLRERFIRVLVADVTSLQAAPLERYGSDMTMIGVKLRSIMEVIRQLIVESEDHADQMIEEVTKELSPLLQQLGHGDLHSAQPPLPIGEEGGSLKADGVLDGDDQAQFVTLKQAITAANETKMWLELLPLVELDSLTSKTLMESAIFRGTIELLDLEERCPRVHPRGGGPIRIGLDARNQAQVLTSLSLSIARRDVGERQHILLMLLSPCFVNEAVSGKLLLLRTLLLSTTCKTCPSGHLEVADMIMIEAVFSESPEAIHQVYLKLCKALPESATARQFRLQADCLKAIMVNKLHPLSQFDIEYLLSSLVRITSIHGPDVPGKFASLIFRHHCSLFQALLTTYRVRLRGRSHLVLQLMSSLLRTLFQPDPDASTPKSIKPRPRPRCFTGRASQLGPTDAIAYTRLLTTLCDPSVSAVTTGGHRNQPSLTPATDKARKQIGQYLPYLLMEYCQCQLYSRLGLGVKEALMPGLYAIFAVADKEMLRTLNASMDTSSRAVFKSLYEDYRRFGTWDQS